MKNSCSLSFICLWLVAFFLPLRGQTKPRFLDNIYLADQVNGKDLFGAGPELVIKNAQPENAGEDRVIVLHPGRSVTSSVAVLSVVVSPKADGTVVAWGANWGGQTTVPVGLTGVVAIAAGA